MQIVLITEKCGCFSWTMPEVLSDRLKETKEKWVAKNQLEYAEQFEELMREDITKYILTLTGVLSTALLTDNPAKIMSLIDERMAALKDDADKLLVQQ